MTKRKELPFEIGDKIKIAGEIKMVNRFTSDPGRKLKREMQMLPFKGPKIVYFVGATNKRAGIIHGAFHYDFETDPAYLQVTETFDVYLCRERIFGREMLVLPSQALEKV